MYPAIAINNCALEVPLETSGHAFFQLPLRIAKRLHRGGEAFVLPLGALPLRCSECSASLFAKFGARSILRLTSTDRHSERLCLYVCVDCMLSQAHGVSAVSASLKENSLRHDIWMQKRLRGGEMTAESLHESFMVYRLEELARRPSDLAIYA